MTTRPLTAGEIALARSVFGDAVDYGRVRLRRRRWWPFQRPGEAMAPDGDIWFHPADPGWSQDFSRDDIAARAWFLHEMTHVWQAQRGGKWFLPLMRHPFCRYRYRLRAGKPFHRYGLEQQAEIVRDAYLAMCRGQADAPQCRLLPFAGTPFLR